MVSGFIADYWGWPAIFYMNGTLGALWTVAYLFLGSASPQQSSMISDEERIYIQTSLGQIGEQKVSMHNLDNVHQKINSENFEPIHFSDACKTNLASEF